MARILSLLVPFCLLLLATASRPSPSSASDDATTTTTTTSEFVRTWCAGTGYPTLCAATLSPYSTTVGTSLAKLAWAALTVTLSATRNATSTMKSMASSGHTNLPPVAAQAAGDCASMLGDGADSLRRCVDAMARVAAAEKEKEMTGRMVRFEVDNVRTWASAALTDADMCVEGFRGAAAGGEGGGVREVVKGHVMGVVHLTSNALAIVDAMSKQTPTP
uniref:Pectinesterase inhibitor domain-containing protein n=1 Tax=Leersia perrieri TaxID=77586 RepID=A0A0D9XLD1_9ORYZ